MMALRARRAEVPFRKGARVGGALGVVLLYTALVGWVARSMLPVPTALIPHWEKQEEIPVIESSPHQYRFRGVPLVLSGRIVRADGTPVPFADVATTVWRGATVSTWTFLDGTFDELEVHADTIDHVVVTIGASTIYYKIDPPKELPARLADNQGARRVSVGDLVFEPVRVLPVSAECARFNGGDIHATFRWQGHTVARAALLDADAKSVDWLHVHGAGGVRPAHAPSKPGRRFRRDIMVPPGTHEVSVSGACGASTVTVDIPAEGTVPQLVLQLK